MNCRYSILFLILIFLVSCKKEEPIASFSLSKTQAEVDEVITITNSSEHSTNFAWAFGDGTTSTSENPGSHQYSTEGVFTIELTATGEGGSDVASNTVTVAYPDPIADFTMDKDSVELEENVTFTNRSENAASYSWSFGDGNSSTNENPVHAFSEAGTYTVQLTATGPGGATNSTSESIVVVWPDPVADFTVDKTEATPGETFTFTNASEYAESYSWDFGDGSTSTVTDPTHSYVDEGLYTVQLTATGYNGETDTYSMAVSVCHPPEAEFIIDVYDADTDVDLNFTNQSTNADSYVWDFGDGTTSTSENPSHAYSSGGTFTVQLTASGDCGSDTYSAEVRITETNIFAGTGVMDMDILELWGTIKDKIDDWAYLGNFQMAVEGGYIIMHVVESEAVGLWGYFISASASTTMSDDDICFQLNCLENFVGQTEESISMGDPLTDVDAAYGPPDTHNTTNDQYWYDTLGIAFFYDGSENVDGIGVYLSSDSKKSSYDMDAIRDQMRQMDIDFLK